VLVATPVPSTATVTALPPTPTRADTPTPTETAEPTITPTPSLTPENISTQVAQPTALPTLIPSPIPVQAPQLVAPADGERIAGANKTVLLQYQPAQVLGAQDWYRVQVDFLDRAGNPVSWCGFSKESQQEFPSAYFDESSPNVRSFLWRVNVVRSNQAVPTTCDAPYDLLSAPSEVRTYYWY
jgi:hypothetical protein